MIEIKGAEATVEIKENRVLKRRKSKEYRHKELDQKIRIERTETELNLIEEANRYNVSVPKAERIHDFAIEIEKIEGNPVKEVLDQEQELMRQYGKNIGLLHSSDIIHGDLTTSNAVLDPEGKLYIIDFGLAFRSERIEDKAVDIHLLKQVLRSSHPEVSEKAWKKFLNGYKNYEDYDSVLKRLEEVEKRGRYK